MARSRPVFGNGSVGEELHQDLGNLTSNATSNRASNRNTPILENGRLKAPNAADALELSLVRQRKSIVSIRLTDPEFAILRDRADESGISVSAYMRSCVLEAETLRAQVKQAMAEMRSLNVVSGRQNYPALTVSTASGSNAHERSGDRLRGFLRSITVLLSPLLTFRRSA
jgi:hypothetical protein